MGVEQMIAKNSRQTAVYWGNPENDRYGKKLFDAPVEILCRWESGKQVAFDKVGKSFVSKSLVYTNEILEEEGMLYLGTLEDLDAILDSNLSPYDTPNALEIKRIDIKPSIATPGQYSRIVYLTDVGYV